MTLDITVSTRSACDLDLPGNALSVLFDSSVRIDDLPVEFSTEILAKLLDGGWVRKNGDEVRMSIPLFTEEDGEKLLPIIEGITGEIAESVYTDYPDDVYAALDERGFSFIRSDYPVRAMDLAQLGCVDSLVEHGVLKKPVADRPPSWGAFGWRGRVAPMYM